VERQRGDGTISNLIDRKFMKREGVRKRRGVSEAREMNADRLAGRYCLVSLPSCTLLPSIPLWRLFEQKGNTHTTQKVKEASLWSCPPTRPKGVCRSHTALRSFFDAKQRETRGDTKKDRRKPNLICSWPRFFPLVFLLWPLVCPSFLLCLSHSHHISISAFPS